MVATTPVTIEQAAAILGLSTSTVRRRIRDGRLRAEEVSRPQGIMRLVYLPDEADSGVAQVSAPDGVVTTTAVTSPGDSMIAYTQTLLLPLVEALERSQATVREQAETIGQLRAENAALVARTAPQPVEPVPERARVPATPVKAPTAPEPAQTASEAFSLLSRRLWWVVVTVGAIALAVALLAGLVLR